MKLRTNIHEFDHRLRPVRVFGDELARIIDEMEASGLDVTIGDDVYEYASLDELRAERGSHPRRVWLVGRQPRDGTSITFVVAGSTALLHASYPHEFGTLPRQLLDIVAPTKSHLAEIFDPRLWGALLILGGFMQFMGAEVFDRHNRSMWPALGLIGVGCLALGSAMPFFYTGVWLRRRHEGGAIRRNGEKLILLLLGAVLGAVAQVVVGRIAGNK